MTTPAPTGQTLPAGTVAAFVTLGGAPVALIRDPNGTPYDHRWRCLGCGDASRSADSVHGARKDANGHAGQCRSIPLPTT